MNTYLFIENTLLVLMAMAMLYLFIFAIAGHFYRDPHVKEVKQYRKIAVLIPGYKEDAVIVEVARAALKQNYPRTAFDVVVIADSFKNETIEQLQQLPIKTIIVSFENSTKSKALNRALELLPTSYEIAVVLDADNIMEPQFLEKCNAAFDMGHRVIQGHRKAKNLNTPWAILDAVSEEINNHIFRKGHQKLGLSAAIIGSGIAIEYGLFKKEMASAKAVGGFDKELELSLLKKGIEIGYLDDAIVYDEKTQKQDVLTNQRRRWLAAQFHYLKLGVKTIIPQLFKKRNFDYVEKVIQFAQPPRILLLAFILISTLIFGTINTVLKIPGSHTLMWIVLSVSTIGTFMLSIPKTHYNKETLYAIKSIPKGVILMLRSLFKIKGANKTFLHTQHTTTHFNTDLKL